MTAETERQRSLYVGGWYVVSDSGWWEVVGAFPTNEPTIPHTTGAPCQGRSGALAILE